MSIQSPVADTAIYIEGGKHHSIVINPARKTNRKKRIIEFLKGLNPFTWFNELSNITITLEELDTPKSKVDRPPND